MFGVTHLNHVIPNTARDSFAPDIVVVIECEPVVQGSREPLVNTTNMLNHWISASSWEA